MTNADESAAIPQKEAARFGSAVSEALLQGMQENIAFLLNAINPIGTYIHSALTLVQFQGLMGSGWVLADGGDCTGSDYAVLTGNTTVPNAAGIFLRGKNNGRSTSTGNSNGNVALGTFATDQLIAHTHSTHYRTPSASSGGSDGGGDHDRGLNDVTETSGSTGTGTESYPRNLTTNIFFRIN